MRSIDRQLSHGIFHACASLCVCLALAANGSAAGGKKKPEETTVIAGSVFRVPGYALPEAVVTLTLRDDPKAKKLAQETTNFRGEFAFHVPAAAAVYVVKASAKGYHAESREATVTGMDRVDLTFNLEPETKK